MALPSVFFTPFATSNRHTAAKANLICKVPATPLTGQVE